MAITEHGAARLDVARVRADFPVLARHRTWPLHGVQFHPESFLTVEGPKLLRNFLTMT